MDLRLHNARISFAQGLFNASSAVEGGTPKYSSDFLICEDTRVDKKTPDGKWTTTTLKAAEAEVVLEAFRGDKAKAKAWFDDLERNQRSIREGNRQKDKAGEIRSGYEGLIYVHATSKTRMPVYNAAVQPIENEADSPIYSGCRVVARVSLYAMLKTGQKGVFASMQGTQFWAAGDAIGGGGRAASTSDFEAASGADAGDFSAAGADSDNPFA